MQYQIEKTGEPGLWQIPTNLSRGSAERASSDLRQPKTNRAGWQRLASRLQFFTITEPFFWLGTLVSGLSTHLPGVSH